MIEIDRRPIQCQRFGFAHAGVQQQAQRRKPIMRVGLSAVQLDQRHIEPLQFGGLEEVLHFAARPRRDGDLVRIPTAHAMRRTAASP